MTKYLLFQVKQSLINQIYKSATMAFFFFSFQVKGEQNGENCTKKKAVKFLIAFYGIYFMVESHKCTGFTYVQLPSNMAVRRAKAYASTSEAVTYHHQSLKHDLKQSFGSFWQMGPDMIFDSNGALGKISRSKCIKYNSLFIQNISPFLIGSKHTHNSPY